MKRNQILKALIMCLVLFSIIPVVNATTTVFEPPTGITDPEKYYGVYLKPDGTMRADTIMIPIVSTMWEQAIIGAHLFPDITLSYRENINSATLSLYFDGDLETSAEPLWITVYGAKAVFDEEETLSGIDRGFPVTTQFKNVNLINVTSAQWIDVNVTKIVQEIVNMYGWSTGKGLAFIIYGTPTDTSRSYQSNVGTKYPTLNVTYGELPPDPPEGKVIDVYRGYTIVYASGTFEGFLVDAGDIRLYTYNETEWEYTALPFTDMKGTGSDLGALIGNDLYFMGRNGTGSLYLFKLSEDEISTIGALPTSSGIVWTFTALTYYPPENKLYLFGALGERLDRWTYNLGTGAISARATLANGNAGYACEGLDVFYWNQSLYVACALPYPTTVRFLQYSDGAWSDTVFKGVTYGTNPRIGVSDNIIGLMYSTGSGASHRYVGVAKTGVLVTDWGDPVVLGDNSNIGYTGKIYDPFSDITWVTWSSSDAEAKKEVAYMMGGVWYPRISTTGGNFTGYSLQSTVGIIFNNSANFIIDIKNDAVSKLPPATLGGGNIDLFTWQYYGYPIHDGATNGLGSIVSFNEYDMWYILDENGTIISDTCKSLECAISVIDNLLGADPDDPSPPGWDETGWFTRARFKLYFFALGLSLIFIPLYTMIRKMQKIGDSTEKILTFWVMLLCWFIGISLLWGGMYL